MPRIRSIKPEYWGDEKMAVLDPTTRLVFLGLISLADDAGRLVDNVKTIDGFVFPETEDSSRDSLEVLARLGRITRYRSPSGQRLIQITNWARHQRVDNPNKYTLPAPTPELVDTQEDLKSSREPSEDLATSSENPSVTILINDQRSTIYDPDQRPAINDQRPASVAAFAASRPPALTGRFARVREALPDEHREALDALVHTCRSPDALLAELEALANGMRAMHPIPTWAHIGQALSDLVLNGERPTALLVRTYVQRVARETAQATSASVDVEGDDIMAAARRAQRQRKMAGGAS